MDKKQAIAAVERRAFEARKTMSEICDLAGVNLSVWSRAKSRDAISVGTLRKVEAALSIAEQEQSV